MKHCLWLLPVLLPAAVVETACVHRTSNAYSTDTVKIDTIEKDNDFPVDTAPVHIDSLSMDSTSRIDSSSLVSPVQSDEKPAPAGKNK